MDAERIEMNFSNAVSPCVVMPADDNGSFSYMILPVRLKAGA